MVWEKVCLPIVLGGLGIRKLVHFNKALLGKWLRRFGREGTHLWRRVIASKYGEGQGGWNTKICRRAHGCGLWHGIHDDWESFSNHVTLVVGDGSRILFWHDKWVGDNSLKGSILSCMCVLMTRKFAFLMFYATRRVVAIEFGI